jgi:hypothetical protein
MDYKAAEASLIATAKAEGKDEGKRPKTHPGNLQHIIILYPKNLNRRTMP